MKHSQFIFILVILIACTQKNTTEEAAVDSTVAAVDTTNVVEEVAEEQTDETYAEENVEQEEAVAYEKNSEEESVGEGPGGYPDPLVSLDGRWVRVFVDATQSMEFFFPTEKTERSQEQSNMVVGYPKFKEGTKLISATINFSVTGGPCTPAEFPGNLSGYVAEPAVLKEYNGTQYTAYANEDGAMQKAYTTNGYFITKNDVCYVFALLLEESTYRSGPDDPGLPDYDSEALFNSFDAMMNSVKY